MEPGREGRKLTWRNWVNALIGVWFVIAPWVLGIANEKTAAFISVIVGAILVVVATWAAIRPGVPGFKIWGSWVTLACGLWFVIHPFLAHFEVSQFWAVVIPALLTMALSLWTLMVNPTGPDAHRRSGPKAPV